MRIVRAEDLADPIDVEDARIVGVLDLEGRKLEHPLILRNCYVEEEINLRQAEIPRIDLSGSHLWGLDAEQLLTKHDVDLDDVITTGREISLLGARIGGCLLVRDARLSNLEGFALRLFGTSIEQDVYADRLTAFGPVELTGAQVRGQVLLRDARLVNPGRVALAAGQLTVGLSLDCSETFHVTGAVELSNATIGGDLTFTGATVHNGTGTALVAHNLTVAGSAFFRHGFTARGDIELLSTSVGGQLSFSGATLSNPGGRTITADRLRVGQSMMLDDGFTSAGEIRLIGAHISGQLLMTGIRMSNRGDVALRMDNLTVSEGLFRIGGSVVGTLEMVGARINGELNLAGIEVDAGSAYAIDADSITVEQALFLSEATLTGGINLTSAHIGWIDLNGTTIDAENHRALSARNLEVDQDVLCRGLKATGDIELMDARISGRLDLWGATLDSPDGYGVELEGLRAGKLRLLPGRPIGGVLDLTDARIGSFEDDPETWPQEIYLRGFVYDVLEHDYARVKHRVEWLRRNEIGYTPGVYDNLAAAYKRAGRVEYARKVNIAKQVHRRSEFGPIGRAWNWLLYLTVGYGYRTSQAWLWLAALLGGGTVVFARSSFVPAAPTVEAFNPFVYALDVLLPIVDLGQQKAWVPQGAAQWCSWGLIAAGWVLTTAVVAGLTNALKRD